MRVWRREIHRNGVYEERDTECYCANSNKAHRYSELLSLLSICYSSNGCFFVSDWNAVGYSCCTSNCVCSYDNLIELLFTNLQPTSFVHSCRHFLSFYFFHTIYEFVLYHLNNNHWFVFVISLNAIRISENMCRYPNIPIKCLKLRVSSSNNIKLPFGTGEKKIEETKIRSLYRLSDSVVFFL